MNLFIQTGTQNIKTNIGEILSFYINVRHVEKHILQLCSLAVLHFLVASIQVPKTKKTYLEGSTFTKNGKDS